MRITGSKQKGKGIELFRYKGLEFVEISYLCDCQLKVAYA